VGGRSGGGNRGGTRLRGDSWQRIPGQRAQSDQVRKRSMYRLLRDGEPAARDRGRGRRRTGHRRGNRRQFAQGGGERRRSGRAARDATTIRLQAIDSDCAGYAEPTVGSAPPWAGVTPAPSVNR